MHRIFLKTADLQFLTGTSGRNCRKIMQNLKDSLGKQKHQHVTIKEYCSFEGINYTEVSEALHLHKQEML